jgi:hypothetical protein
MEAHDITDKCHRRRAFALLATAADLCHFLRIMKRILALLIFLVGFGAQAAERPNILWIYLEDVSG